MIVRARAHTGTHRAVERSTKRRHARAAQKEQRASSAQAASQMDRALRTVMLGLLAVPACAMVFPNYPNVARWNFPTDPLTREGLGRSISYVVDPEFCSTFMPHLAEATSGFSTVTCDEVHQSIARAFETWAAPNPYITFFNATHLCGNLGSDCWAAEIFVTASNVTVAELTGDTLPKIPNAAIMAQRALNGTLPKVLTTLKTNDAKPRTTEGISGVAGEKTIKSATITILSPKDSAANAWYLDTSLCHTFTTMTVDIQSMMTVAFIVGLLVGLLVMSCCIFSMCFAKRFSKNEAHMPTSTNEEVLEGRLELPLPMQLYVPELGSFSLVAILLVALLLLVVPNVILGGYLKPCLTENALEPALLHGIGAALGLGNISSPNAKHLHMASTGGWCMSGGKTRLATLSEDKSFDIDASNLENVKCTRDTWYTCTNRGASVMLSVDALHTRTTLAQDDLDAINVLYPSDYRSCFAAITPALPVGSDSTYAGFRMLLTFAIPFSILALVLPMCVACIQSVARKIAPPSEEQGNAVPTLNKGSVQAGREYAM
jgi:hypothetical protein